ncbi:MAG TPA: CDP-glycerol glycerophosphotransferase family protein [Thermoanaerobaculia bacterium]|jgi:YidC/Oxa1 family membrane protein insertase
MHRHAMFDELRRKWREGREAWAGLRAFQSGTGAAPRIVFYAETAADWAHLGPVDAALVRQGVRVVRVTSDRNDRVLQGPDAYWVGSGGARTVLFRTIEADAFVMTLSDLEQFHLKRSAHPVHYFYVFHSIASTHRVYREHAFDAYDTILCVGPHHFTELRRAEEVYGLPPKRLVEHGYGRLDTLIADLATKEIPPPQDGVTRVLLAPSWGESSMVRQGLEPAIEVLLTAGFEVSLRLHPMTVRHHPRLAQELVRRYEGRRFRFDPDVSTTEALLAADIMISEWSGAPLEYAFARQRPVIFVDTPPKIHNPNHARIGLPALEADIRDQIGKVVAPGELARLPQVVAELVRDAPSWHERIGRIRDETVFNVGRSGDAGAAQILGTLSVDV